MARPIRFLHLTTFYPPWSFGGDAIYVRGLAHALAHAGHEVDVVHCVDAFTLLHAGASPVAPVDHPGVRVHGLRTGLGWLSPLVTHQTGRPALKARALRRILAARPYDVLHFHNISLFGPAVLAVRPPAARPVTLYTAHEHWLVCPTHVLWKHGRVCDRPTCLSCVLRAGRPPQYWRYTGALARASSQVDQFIALSRSSARVHADRGFARPMAHVPCFVDRADADWRRPEPRPHARPYFLFVGRLETIKGLQTLIAAWNDVKDFDLLVAGSGTEERALRAQAGSNPRIHFLGHRPSRALGPLYVHALACILPALTHETFGIVAVEAFSRKTPVIVRDIGALNEIVEESGGGFIYRTPAELRQAIDTLGRRPDVRQEMGERGYQAFERRWSREVHLDAYLALLRQTATSALGRVPWEDA